MADAPSYEPDKVPSVAASLGNKSQSGESVQSWRALYQAAVLELKPDLMLIRIREAQAEIEAELQRIGADGDDSGREALSNALAVLHDLLRLYDQELLSNENE